MADLNSFTLTVATVMARHGGWVTKKKVNNYNHKQGKEGSIMAILKLRKKLSTTIITQAITIIISLLAAKNINVSPDIQAAIVMLAVAIVAYIQKSYNIGQGIADQGKENNNGS